MSISGRSQRSSVNELENSSYNDMTLNLISQLSKKESQVSGLGRDYWLDDSSAAKCRACDRKFTTFRRRHHCRICGKIFCSNCTTFMDGEKFNHSGNMRVCLSCLKLADKIVDYVSSEDESLADDSSSVLHRVKTSDTTSPIKNDIQDFSHEALSSTPSQTENHTAPTPPPMMAIAATRKGEAVEIDVGRTNSLTRKGRANTFMNNRSQMGNDVYPYNRRSSTNFHQPTNNLVNGININPTTTNEEPKNIFDSFSFGNAAAAASSLFNFGTPLSHAPQPNPTQPPHQSQISLPQSHYLQPTYSHSSQNDVQPHLQSQFLPFQPAQSIQPSISNLSSSVTTHTLNSQNSGNNNNTVNSNKFPPANTAGNASPYYSTQSHNVINNNNANMHRHNYNNTGSAAQLGHSYLSRNTSNFMFNSDSQNTHLNGINTGNNGGKRNSLIKFDDLDEDDSDDSDDEEEQTMLAFNPDSIRPIDNLHFTWDASKTSANSMKFDDNSRRNYRSTSNRRISKFQRLKTRRMSKSGTTRLISENNAAGFGRVNSQNFVLDENYEFLDDFLRAGENHARQLLRQSLFDREIEDYDEWENILFRVLKKVSSISIDISAGNSFDIANYLKIKKIPGATINDTNLVDGLVFSKVLALKTMPREIHNPKIMLITFPFEYELDSDNRISTIEPIIAQQKQYLEKLVARIIALNPNIVLLTGSINGIALNLLNEADIAVAYYVKPTIIERLARITNADIITSIDKLARNPRLGKCKEFNVKSYLFEGIIRTYFYFTGCNADLGYTVILRGADKDKLQHVKHCATLMLYILYNNRLEAGLMRDQCLQASEYKVSDEPPKPLGSISMNSHSDFKSIFEQRLLSSSPWVKFEVPFVLKKMSKFESELIRIKELFAAFEAKFSEIKSSQIEELGDDNAHTDEYDEKQLIKTERAKLDLDTLNQILKDWNINVDLTSLPDKLDDAYEMVKTSFEFKEEYLLSELSLTQRQWEQFWLMRKLAFFDPMAHQNIVTLFSMVSTRNATPCAGPDIQVTDYYWENDYSLGQFIEHICLHANDICAEGCNLTMKEHFRSYVHGSGKVDVVIENNVASLSAKEDIISSWSYCKQCYNSTPALPLSDNAWKYSFGKYLELSFWCRGMKVKGATCPHDFYRDQIHYFSFQNLAVRVEYTEIQLLDLAPPKFRLFWNPEINIKIKIDTYKSAIQKAALFFNSVRDRLNRVKVDSMTFDKMEAGQKRIEELKQRVETEYTEIKNLAETIYQKTPVTDHLSLNAIIRAVQELSGDWNAEFQVFDKDYLPTEKEIKRITAFQLDRLFKASSENRATESSSKGNNSAEREKTKPDEHGTETDTETSDAVIAIDEKKAINIPTVNETDTDLELETDADGNGDHEESMNDTTNESLPSSPIQTRKKGQMVLEKIFELEGKKNMESSTSPTKLRFSNTDSRDTLYQDRKLLWESRSKELQDHILNADDAMIPKLDGLAGDNKVKKLTEYFDAQEFFRQREEEKQKLQAAAYRPKVASYRPTAEIYKSIKDAVETEGRGNSQNNNNSATAKMAQQGVSELIGDEEEQKLEAASMDAGEEGQNHSSAQQSVGGTSTVRAQQETMQPEKTSLLKSLSHFWADRSSTLWEPLADPLSSTEHIFVDSDVLVREDEPSSIIAFCLNTSDYSAKLQELNIQSNKQQQHQQQQQQQQQQQHQQQHQSTNAAEAESLAPASEAEGVAQIDGVSVNSSKLASHQQEESKEPNLEEFMLKKGFHLKYQFEEGYSTISCKIFFAEQFDAFRKQCGIDSNFIQSLSRCVKWDSTGGKSGSAFLKTLDDRFIIKELSRTELESFIQLAPSYFEYFAQALFHGLPTVLVKIFGFYQIQVKNSMVGSKSYTLEVLIMENLFYDRKTNRIFDLKGSMRNRHVEQTGKENEVLLDENMVEYIYESPLFVRENAKRLLRASLWNDTLFLAKLNVMDYSLVIGIDSDNSELVVGIIDCIRTFTWDKKLESWVKEKGLVGGTGVGKEPTVITPKQYKNRFREAMERYILMAPGPWHQGT